MTFIKYFIIVNIVLTLVKSASNLIFDIGSSLNLEEQVFNLLLLSTQVIIYIAIVSDKIPRVLIKAGYPLLLIVGLGGLIYVTRYYIMFLDIRGPKSLSVFFYAPVVYSCLFICYGVCLRIIFKAKYRELPEK